MTATRQIHDQLRDAARALGGRDHQPRAAVIDSQPCALRTPCRRPRGWDNGKKVNGCKRHIAVDTAGLVLAVVVTAACVQDRGAARPLLWNPDPGLHPHPPRLGRGWLRRQADGLGRDEPQAHSRDRPRTRRSRVRGPAPQVGGPSAPWPGPPAATSPRRAPPRAPRPDDRIITHSLRGGAREQAAHRGEQRDRSLLVLGYPPHGGLQRMVDYVTMADRPMVRCQAARPPCGHDSGSSQGSEPPKPGHPTRSARLPGSAVTVPN